DMLRNIVHLLLPAALVAAIRPGPALGGQLIEARLVDGEQDGAFGVVELEDDERGRLLLVVHVRVDAIGMPAEGQQPLGLDALDGESHRHMLVAGVGDRPLDVGAGDERSIGQANAKPAAELGHVGQGAPDAGTRGVEQDLLVDTIGGALGDSHYATSWLHDSLARPWAQPTLSRAAPG